MLNVRPTNSTSSRLRDIGSTVSFQNDAVGDGKVLSFLFPIHMVFLDDSGGNIGDNGHVLKLRLPSYRVDSVVFDAEKLLMSNSCEIKWAIDNNSFKNKK